MFIVRIVRKFRKFLAVRRERKFVKWQIVKLRRGGHNPFDVASRVGAAYGLPNYRGRSLNEVNRRVRDSCGNWSCDQLNEYIRIAHCSGNERQVNGLRCIAGVLNLDLQLQLDEQPFSAPQLVFAASVCSQQPVAGATGGLGEPHVPVTQLGGEVTHDKIVMDTLREFNTAAPQRGQADTLRNRTRYLERWAADRFATGTPTHRIAMGVINILRQGTTNGIQVNYPRDEYYALMAQAQIRLDEYEAGIEPGRSHG